MTHMYFSARTEGRISYGHRTDSCFIRIADRAAVYVDRTVEVIGLESVFEQAAWNGSEV